MTMRRYAAVLLLAATASLAGCCFDPCDPCCTPCPPPPEAPCLPPRVPDVAPFPDPVPDPVAPPAGGAPPLPAPSVSDVP